MQFLYANEDVVDGGEQDDYRFQLYKANGSTMDYLRRRGCELVGAWSLILAGARSGSQVGRRRQQNNVSYSRVFSNEHAVVFAIIQCPTHQRSILQTDD